MKDKRNIIKNCSRTIETEEEEEEEGLNNVMAQVNNEWKDNKIKATVNLRLECTCEVSRLIMFTSRRWFSD